jgi:hypothetical protein
MAVNFGADQCPSLEAERKSLGEATNSAVDPKATFNRKASYGHLDSNGRR